MGNVVLQSSIQIFFNTFKLRVLVANVGAGFDFILLIAPQWNKSMKTLFSSIHRVPCGINVHLLDKSQILLSYDSGEIIHTIES